MNKQAPFCAAESSSNLDRCGTRGRDNGLIPHVFPARSFESQQPSLWRVRRAMLACSFPPARCASSFVLRMFVCTLAVSVVWCQYHSSSGCFLSPSLPSKEYEVVVSGPSAESCGSGSGVAVKHGTAGKGPVVGLVQVCMVDEQQCTYTIQAERV